MLLLLGNSGVSGEEGIVEAEGQEVFDGGNEIDSLGAVEEHLDIGSCTLFGFEQHLTTGSTRGNGARQELSLRVACCNAQATNWLVRML